MIVADPVGVFCGLCVMDNLDAVSPVDLLNALIRRAGLSQAGFARACGYSRPSSVSRFFERERYIGGHFSSDLIERRFLPGLLGRGAPAITADEVWQLGRPSARKRAEDQVRDGDLKRAAVAVKKALDMFAKYELTNADERERRIMAAAAARIIVDDDDGTIDIEEAVRNISTLRRVGF